MAKIMLDKEREINFNLNAFCRFEEVTGKNALEALGKLTATDVRALLWAALNDPDLTVEAVGALITPDNLGEVKKSLLEISKNPTRAQRS